jgi:hypothetical protein
MNRVALLFAVAAFPVALCAQWPDYPTPNVPKTPDGKVNLNGPTPRTADGHPDLSGVWENRRGNIGRPPRGFPAPEGAPRGAPPPPPPPADSGPPAATFFNIGAGFPGGKLPLQPWAADLLKKRTSENSKDNPDAHCLPMGLMQLHEHPQPRKIIQTPAVTVIIYEANSGLRQIFTDGRPLPPKDVQPWWYGYSVGHWEGDTLVVETTNFTAKTAFRGSSEKMRLTERFKRMDADTLLYQYTVDDPASYEKPWTVEIPVTRSEGQMFEYACHEGNYAMTGGLAGARAQEKSPD